MRKVFLAVLSLCCLSYGNFFVLSSPSYMIAGGLINMAVSASLCWEQGFYDNSSSYWQSWRFILLRDGDSISNIGNQAMYSNNLLAFIGAAGRGCSGRANDTLHISFDISTSIKTDSGYAIKFYDYIAGTVITSPTFKIKNNITHLQLTSVAPIKKVSHSLKSFLVNGRFLPISVRLQKYEIYMRQEVK